MWQWHTNTELKGIGKIKLLSDKHVTHIYSSRTFENEVAGLITQKCISEGFF